MTRTTTAITAAMLAMTAAPAHAALTMKRAHKEARHARHLDAAGNYDAEGWMGGELHFGRRIACERQSGRVVLCVYNVTRQDGQLRCERGVTVTRRHHAVSTGVRFGECAKPQD